MCFSHVFRDGSRCLGRVILTSTDVSLRKTNCPSHHLILFSFNTVFGERSGYKIREKIPDVPLPRTIPQIPLAEILEIACLRTLFDI